MSIILLVVFNVKTLATEEVNNTNTNSSRTIITATPVNNTANNTNNTSNDNNTNTNNTNTNTNTNSANNVVNNTNSSRNSSSYVNSSSLPYAGTSSSIIFIVIALGVSAIYAYKKVKEYGE